MWKLFTHDHYFPNLDPNITTSQRETYNICRTRNPDTRLALDINTFCGTVHIIRKILHINEMSQVGTDNSPTVPFSLRLRR